MRDYFGLFLVMVGLAGVILWVRGTPQVTASVRPPSLTNPKVKIVSAPQVKQAFALRPHSTRVQPEKTAPLSAGIFDEDQQQKEQIRALGIPLVSYIQDQNKRFPHANVYPETKEGLRLYLQCWEIKDPNPAIVPPAECQNLLARKRVETGRRLYSTESPKRKRDLH